MFDKFTDRARKVMSLARQEAQRFNHECIGTEHILLGLVGEGSGIAARVLNILDVDLKKIRVAVENLIPHGPPTVQIGQLPFTPRAKRVLEFAQKEAIRLGHGFISTEHILLGLLVENEGVAAQVLVRQGLRLEDVREEILDVLGAHAFPRPHPQASAKLPRAPEPPPTWADVMRRLGAYQAGCFGYAPATRQAFARALAAALVEGASQVQTAHLFAALGVGRDLDLQRLIRAMEQGTTNPAPSPPLDRPLPFSVELRDVVRVAQGMARARRHEAITPAHLLSALLLREATSSARFTDIPVDAVRARLASVRTILKAGRYYLGSPALRGRLEDLHSEIACLERKKEEAIATQDFVEAAQARDQLMLKYRDHEKIKTELTVESGKSAAGWAARISAEATSVLDAATREASGRCVAIAPPVLLGSLLAADSSRGAAIMRAAGLDAAELRADLDRAVSSLATHPPSQEPRVPASTVAVLLAASAEAGGLGWEAIGSEHLLLGLLSVRDEAPARLLGAEGFTLDAARFAALELSLVRGA